MRIITWNCNMAFRKKAEMILAYQADILVVPECECPEKLLFNAGTAQPTDVLWFGSNKHKGLGIFSYSNYRFRVLENHNEAFKMIIPIAVAGGDFDFNLFAVWANNPTDKDGQYVEQVWKAINHYKDTLTDTPCILTGDFNSNTIWDRKYRVGNHSDVVKYLADKDIHSAYHLHHTQVQGKEKHPTFYLYKHADKPYHLDYCFLSAALAKRVKTVEVGNLDDWAKYSDHVTVMVTLN
jgi:exodeoxyribonuclease-3